MSKRTQSRPASRRAIGLIISLAAVTSSCPTSWAEVKNPDTFVYAIAGDVDSVDPHWQYDGISQMVIWQTYETLIAYKNGSVTEFTPLLTTIVPTQSNSLLSRDGLTYTFPIRSNIHFHDGTPLTAEDVKYSLMRFLLMDRAGGGSGLLLDPILGVASTRDETGKPNPDLYDAADEAILVQGGAVVIKLRKPFSPFLSILASFGHVVSKSWTAAHGGWDGRKETWAILNNPAKESSYLYDHVNGTGPFMLDRWDKAQKKISLIRNEKYWRAPAKLKRILFETIDELITRKLLLSVGDADAAIVERPYLPQMAGLDGIAIEDDLPFYEVHNAFIFNFNIEPHANPYIGSGKLDGDGVPPDFFSDWNIRAAMARAFNYDAFINEGYRGKAIRARGPIPAGIFGYHYNQSVFPYNLKEAADYFKRAFGGKVWDQGFRFTLSYMQGRSDRLLACQILKKGIEEINPKFKVDIRGIQWSNFLDASVAKRLPMVNARWAMDYPDPHNCVYAFLHSHGYYASLAGYSNARADSLVENAVQQMDPDKQRAIYRDLQEIAYTDLPAIFTVDTYYARVYRNWVHGWTYNPMLMYGYLYPVYKKEP